VSIYLVNNIGLPVYYHYCGGELESVSALFKAGGCCGEAGEDQDSDCCKNETKIISQKSESALNNFQYKVVPPVIDLSILRSPLDFSFKVDSFTPAFISLKFPPPENGRGILASKSVLII
jgi:hypothetical protein